MQALMSQSTSSSHTDRLMQLWQSEPKKRVKEEMKGGNRERERKKKIIWVNLYKILEIWLFQNFEKKNHKKLEWLSKFV